MSVYGYEIRNSLDFFRKLLDEREDFLNNPVSSRHAINCTLTGWHLHEWIFEEYKSNPALVEFKKLENFRSFLYKRCGSFKTFKDLANGSKHFLLSRETTILNTEIREAGSQWSITRKFDSPTLIVETQNMGVKIGITFDDLLYDVACFWYEYFLMELKLDVNDIVSEYTSF